MRRALVVGIDFYDAFDDLAGAVNDAHNVRAALERNADGTTNFGVKTLTGTGPTSPVNRATLREEVANLFSDDAEVALLYFAGHGFIDETGGYLCSSDSAEGHDGLSLRDVMTLTNRSEAKNKVIILDSCHSGAAGDSSLATRIAEISDGVTILTASTANQSQNGTGVFTNLLVDALNGAAANLVGAVTPGSVYAHIDQSLGPWAQRPVFKTNVRSFVSLRQATAPIELSSLLKLTSLFADPAAELPLDPSYEPERAAIEPPSLKLDLPAPDPIRNAEFAILQDLVKVNLVRPVGAPHMWHAAMQSKSCELTVLGQHYWSLVREGLI